MIKTGLFRIIVGWVVLISTVSMAVDGKLVGSDKIGGSGVATPEQIEQIRKVVDQVWAEGAKERQRKWRNARAEIKKKQAVKKKEFEKKEDEFKAGIWLIFIIIVIGNILLAIFRSNAGGGRHDESSNNWGEEDDSYDWDDDGGYNPMDATRPESWYGGGINDTSAFDDDSYTSSWDDSNSYMDDDFSTSWDDTDSGGYMNDETFNYDGSFNNDGNPFSDN